MKKLLFKLIRFSSIPFFFREFIQKNKVTILLFHNINIEAANQAFKFLKENYNIISLDFFLKASETNNPKLLPPKSLIITFDDGHIGNYDILPIIKKYKIPITIFLCAGIINTNRDFWFLYKHPDLNINEMKKLSTQERLELLEGVGFSQTKVYKKSKALNKVQIEEMKEFVNFQSHTMFHPILPNCSDAEALEEIKNSKFVLENNFNLKINAIAYPNGDYSERDILICKEAGYKLGITVDYGFNTIEMDPFRLKRLSVNDTDNIDELIVKSSGFWAFVKTNIRKKNMGIKIFRTTKFL